MENLHRDLTVTFSPHFFSIMVKYIEHKIYHLNLLKFLKIHSYYYAAFTSFVPIALFIL